MRDQAYNRLETALISTVVAGLLLYAFGCQSQREAVAARAWPAGAAAAGAGIGLAVGPVGAVVGAGVGAIAGSAIGENAELRSGSLQGQEAKESELEYWKGTAGDNARRTGHLRDLLAWALWLTAGWFAWRNRAHFRRALTQKSIAPIFHAIFGSNR